MGGSTFLGQISLLLWSSLASADATTSSHNKLLAATSLRVFVMHIALCHWPNTQAGLASDLLICACSETIGIAQVPDNVVWQLSSFFSAFAQHSALNDKLKRKSSSVRHADAVPAVT